MARFSTRYMFYWAAPENSNSQNMFETCKNLRKMSYEIDGIGWDPNPPEQIQYMKQTLHFLHVST